MCGIAGQLRFDGRPPDRAVLEAMGRALVHRGPDSDGLFVDARCGLVFRRLAIIDLSEAARQPMGNEDGSLQLVFNGEIYDFARQRDELITRGHRFRSRSDTEVIVHRFEERGARVVDDLRGMFAFAAWDAHAGRLVLARDRVGKKPLYYHHDARRITFASELAALLCDPEIPRGVDREALDLFLAYQYVPGARSMIPGVKKLPPAHTLTVDAGGAKLERYWQLSYEPKPAVASEDALAGEVLERLDEAVRIRMIADVPLGAFLSGGVDSSAVVALMSRHASKPVKTFSIGFTEEDYSELPYAREVAQRFGTDHHEFIVRPEAVELLPLLVRHYGDPYADSSAIATYYVARETRRHVTVALNGDGGDESFAGYDRYVANQWVSMYRMVPSPIRAGIARALDALPEPDGAYSLLRRAKRFAAAAQGPESDAYLKLVASLDRPLRERLYTAEMRAALAGHEPGEVLAEALARTDARSAVDKTMALDVATYLPDDLLVKVDIATMANSLEGRSPFLDHRLMELAARIPGELKLSGRTTKYILKKALATLLPARILHRRKMGFGVPIKKWFRGPLLPMLRESLLDARAAGRGYFERAAVEALIDEHASGRRDHGYRLYTLLMLELWHRVFLDT